MLLIPSIDLQGGRVVRLRRGRFDDVTEYACAPGELCARYGELGAPWVHLVDLDGARTGNGEQRALVARLARDSGVLLQVGGGLRDLTSVDALLAAGAARVVLGTLALTDPDATRSALGRHGGERIVLALDVRRSADGTPFVATHGWARDSARTLWEVVADYRPSGLRHVLCTDIEQDGLLAGPSLALYREGVRRFPDLAWQASGGVSGVADLTRLAETGVAAAIAGRALLENRLREEEFQPFLPNA